ncbi:MAG: hypothetical protein RLZZ337_2065 [Bacteroidota bacterium]|jgi:predicted CoA-binding protein
MQQNKKTLVIGATPNSSRFAYIATEMLQEYHHDVVLFGIKKGLINDLTIHNEWPEDKDIDTITLYINEKLQEQYYDAMLNSGAKRIIFNPGTENAELAQLAKAKNMEALNACTLVLLRTNQY